MKSGHHFRAQTWEQFYGNRRKSRSYKRKNYAEIQYKEGQFYGSMEIINNVLSYISYDPDGNVKDRFTITKPIAR